MKTTPNPTFSFEIEPGKNATAGDLLAVCLARTPEGGFDFATMRSRNRVAEVIEKLATGGAIVLEDADHKTAVDAVRVMKWGMSHPDLIKFAELWGL